MQPISPEEAASRYGITTRHDEMDNGEIRFRLEKSDGVAYIRTEQVAAWSGRGRQPIHRKPQCAAHRVDQWAVAQIPNAWRRMTLREGEKGLVAADYLHAQVWV